MSRLEALQGRQSRERVAYDNWLRFRRFFPKLEHHTLMSPASPGLLDLFLNPRIMHCEFGVNRARLLLKPDTELFKTQLDDLSLEVIIGGDIYRTRRYAKQPNVNTTIRRGEDVTMEATMRYGKSELNFGFGSNFREGYLHSHLGKNHMQETRFVAMHSTGVPGYYIADTDADTYFDDKGAGFRYSEGLPQRFREIRQNNVIKNALGLPEGVKVVYSGSPTNPFEVQFKGAEKPLLIGAMVLRNI